jgi:hypothetical protein
MELVEQECLERRQRSGLRLIRRRRLPSRERPPRDSEQRAVERDIVARDEPGPRRKADPERSELLYESVEQRVRGV